MKMVKTVAAGLVISVLALAAAGCSMQKGGEGFVAPAPVEDGAGASSARTLSYVIGTWTGSETASYGESGSLTVTFTQPPTPGAAVNADIAWTSAQSSLTFHGSLSGTLSNMVINASDAPGACSYHASGTLNEAGTQITGSYTGNGPAPCPSKAGTFILNGQSFVPPPPPVDVCPNIEGAQGTVPPGYQITNGQCVPVPPPPPQDCGTTSYWQMLNGSDKGNARQNKCENTGGVWLGNTTVNGQPAVDVCKFAPNPPGNPGQDMTLLYSEPIVCPVGQ